jgi:hypothetical protein
MSRLHAAQSPLPLVVSTVKYCYILQIFYLPLLARTRIRFRRFRGDTHESEVILDTPPPSKNPSSKKFLPLYADDSDEPLRDSDDSILDTPPPSRNPSSKKFLPLYADDSDEPPRDSDDDNLAHTYLAKSEDEYDVFSDIELTDELIAALDKTQNPALDKTQSEDEYAMSDIELTDELLAILDKTHSEDEFAMSDIELTDDLIAALDKTY